MFNPERLLFKECLSISMFSPTTGERFWTLEDIKDDFTLTFSADNDEKTDASGAVVAKYWKAKKVQASGNTSFMTLSMIASQFGSEKNVGSATNLITSKKREKITVGATSGTVNTTITLSQIPVGTSGSEIPYIYIYNGKNVGGDAYAVATTASATNFSIDAATKTITLPNAPGITADSTVLVYYDYETEDAVEIINSTDETPKSGEVWIESLFTDICDKNIEYHGWYIINSAQLSAETEIPFNKTGDFPFTIDSLVDYCSTDNQLLRLVIPEE